MLLTPGPSPVGRKLPDDDPFGLETNISEASKGKKIIMCTAGSRGDIQPMVALACELQKSGFEVLVLSNSNHVDFIQKFSLKAQGTNFDFEEFFNNPEIAKVVGQGDFKRYMEAKVRVLRSDIASCFEKTFQAFKEYKPDLYICPLSDLPLGLMWGALFDVPCVTTCLAQIIFPSKVHPSLLNEPCFHYSCAWLSLTQYYSRNAQLVDVVVKEASMDAATREFLVSFRATMQRFTYDLLNPLGPCIFGVSGQIMPNPPDWTIDAHAPGFWVVSKKEQMKRFERQESGFGGKEVQLMAEFIKAGPPPVYMGWGSLTVGTAEAMMCLAARALKFSGKRGILLSGWAKLNPGMLAGQPDSQELCDYLKKNVLIVDTAPHEWLFPQCAVTVHHGGAGTTVASLRSGKPVVVTPCFFDQFMYADMVARLGCGMGMPQFQKVTPQALAAAILQCCNSTEIHMKAIQICDQLQSEDGLVSSVEIIDSFFATEVSSGSWKVKHDAKKEKLHELSKKTSFVDGLKFFARVCCTAKPFG